MLDPDKSYYSGDDLGAVYHPNRTDFRVFAPTAERVELCLYHTGSGEGLYNTLPMNADQGGTWHLSVPGDLNGVYYTYRITIEGEARESFDPYAKACGVNGRRSMVVNLKDTNPEGFGEDHGPTLKSPVDAVVCEVSILDTTLDASSGAEHKGKYLGLARSGLKTASGKPIGLDYYRDLGVTHLQIMPSYDFGSIDESKPLEGQYNWGYDPVNYNVPEGSFATDPGDGAVRVREYKQMVQAIHSMGLGVIMDVVYNHTYSVEGGCFDLTAPGYYYRMDGDRYSDASACGNEVASDKPMVRKYIVDSVLYWAKEYHVDGFRFDLMGVLDIETMNELSRKLHELNPSILLYGEGWTGGASTLDASKRALKVNVGQLDGVGVFSDDIRDTIKGHVFEENRRGFVNGEADMENAVRFCLTGAVRHPEVDYKAYTYTTTGPYAKSPCDVVNYVSCHDNLTLWDKLSLSCPEASEEERLAMNRLAACTVFWAQGVPFFLQGEEWARSKPIEGSDQVSENSYNLPAYTNSLKYDRMEQYWNLREYYKGLIAFRKGHPGLRLRDASDVRNAMHFPETGIRNVVAVSIKYGKEKLLLVLNANKEAVELKLPLGSWQVYVDGSQAGNEILRTEKRKAVVQGLSGLALIKS